MQRIIIWQVGVVVEDIDKAVHKYAGLLGMDIPEVISEEVAIDYKGCSKIAHNKIAFFNFPLMQLEIIQPYTQSSVWMDFLTQHGPGIFHMSTRVDNIDETRHSKQFEDVKILQENHSNGVDFSILDTMESLLIGLSVFEKS